MSSFIIAIKVHYITSMQGSSWALAVGRSDSQIGRSYIAELWPFCQFRSKLAITHPIAIKWKEKLDAVVVDCHHNVCLVTE